MINKLIILIFYLFIQPASAQSVPPLINYQGMLTDSEGKPLANGTKKLTFNIYESADSTTPVWGPQVFPSIPVINGYFNVILGPVKTDANGIPDQGSASIIQAFGAGNRFLGITVDNGAEVKPRQQILSTPYAIRAQNAPPVGSIVSSMLTPDQFAIITDDNFQVEVSKRQWTLADGKNVAGSVYAQVTGSTNIPDLRGMFLRGLNAGRDDGKHDVDGTLRVVGDYQADEYRTHKHNGNMEVGAEPITGGARATQAAGAHGRIGDMYVSSDLIQPSGGNETRPRNIAVYYYMKIN